MAREDSPRFPVEKPLSVSRIFFFFAVVFCYLLCVTIPHIFPNLVIVLRHQYDQMTYSIFFFVNFYRFFSLDVYIRRRW